MNNRNDEKKLQWFIREIERLQRERDEARAEVERLRALLRVRGWYER